MWPDYLRETCEFQVSSAKHIKFDSKQKLNYMPMLGDLRYFAVYAFRGLIFNKLIFNGFRFQGIEFQWFPVFKWFQQIDFQ